MFAPLVRRGASAARPARVAAQPLSYRLLSTTTAVRGLNKVLPSAAEAVKSIKSGQKVAVGGFGPTGMPTTLLSALSKTDVNDLTLVGQSGSNWETGKGLDEVISAGQVSNLITSHVGLNPLVIKKWRAGELRLHFTPQGSMAERMRAGGFGIPAFYTPSGIGTLVHKGGLTVEFSKDEPGKAVELSKAKEERVFNGKNYMLEEAIHTDVALIHAWKADEQGNAVFRYSGNNFSAPFAKNAKVTIVEAEEIVPTGSLDPNFVHLPSVFVQQVVKATEPKEALVVKTSDPAGAAKKPASGSAARREKIARRAAQEFQNGDVVNLGIGLPTQAAGHVPAGVNITLQSENGITGMGTPPSAPMVDFDIIDSGASTSSLQPGAAVFDSSESFGMIRGGRMNLTMLGALQVGANGDLANYMVPGSMVAGMGGAMDLVAAPETTRVIVLTDHVDKSGKPKIVADCSLPLTGPRVVSRIITDLAVFDVDRTSPEGGLTLVEIMDGATLNDIKEKTGAPFKVAHGLQ